MTKEGPQVTDVSLPIGRSSYILSSETQNYLTKIDAFDFRGENPVIVIQEPHFSLDGQISLFKGLENLFQDNPDLVKKTAFLAEGYPANQLVSVASLIEEEPQPTDELIHEVLSSFLITGYMAYEWKHQQEIPIIGTEDRQFYELSRDLIVAETKNPGELFAQVSFKNGPTVDVTFEHIQTFSYVIRNKKMVETLFEMRDIFENPILFVGYCPILN